MRVENLRLQGQAYHHTVMLTVVAAPTHFLSAPMFHSSPHRKSSITAMSWVIRENSASSLAGRLSLQQILVCLHCSYMRYWFNQGKCENPRVWCARSKSLFNWCLPLPLLFLFVPQQARAEQEEEFISNTLFKKIQALQKEKETLAVNYEKEEEFLTNELSRKLMQVSDGNKKGHLHLAIPIFSSVVVVVYTRNNGE